MEGSSQRLPYGGNPASTLARAASNTSKMTERDLLPQLGFGWKATALGGPGIDAFQDLLFA